MKKNATLRSTGRFYRYLHPLNEKNSALYEDALKLPVCIRIEHPNIGGCP